MCHVINLPKSYWCMSIFVIIRPRSTLLQRLIAKSRYSCRTSSAPHTTTITPHRTPHTIPPTPAPYPPHHHCTPLQVFPVFGQEYFQSDFSRVSFPGVSSTIWAISPPSRQMLVRDLRNTLTNPNVSVPLEFYWSITRWAVVVMAINHQVTVAIRPLGHYVAPVQYYTKCTCKQRSSYYVHVQQFPISIDNVINLFHSCIINWSLILIPEMRSTFLRFFRPQATIIWSSVWDCVWVSYPPTHNGHW